MTSNNQLTEILRTGQDVTVRLVTNDIDVPCRLEVMTDLGVVLAAAHDSSERFQTRFYPWANIAHIDLGANAQRSGRVA